jgi:hypothetical protein
MCKFLAPLLFLIASTANAQIFPHPLWNPWINAVDSRAAIISAISQNQINITQARINQQTADRMRLENKQIHNENVREYWKLRDEYNTREFNKHHPSIIEKRLDAAVKNHELKQKEQQLRQQGVLPPKPDPHFTINGKKFASYQEWRNSPEYDRFIRNRDLELEQAAVDQGAKQVAAYKSIEKSMLQDAYKGFKPDFWEQISKSYGKQTAAKVQKDPFYRVYVLNQNIPFSEWPDHWKTKWKKDMDIKHPLK